MIAPGLFGGARGSDGATLLEVMVALVLLALMVVPVALGVDSAVQMATSVRVRAETLSEESGSAGAGPAWKWGPALKSAAWGPGPTLELAVRAQEEDVCAVGLWCDGWFLGEREPDSCGRLCVEAPELRDLMDGELVVRVRDTEGTWGPPWRSIIPDSTGASPSADTDDGSIAALEDARSLPRAAAHAPALAHPALDLPSGAGEAEPVHPGLIFRVTGRTEGNFAARLEGRVQSWLMEEGRALDVYF
ncbi:MAG: hypothetical protein JW990_12165 [Thermoleophilia bacterium]|nr:hypothetical protein [Thermoleophilia bacterium]